MSAKCSIVLPLGQNSREVLQNYHNFYRKNDPVSPLGVDRLVEMLSLEGAEMELLLEEAGRCRSAVVGDGVYLRGLIEYSNICRKDCHYCGIRRSSSIACRYTLTEGEVLECARYAFEKNYGSIVIQGGENRSEDHISAIVRLVGKIKELTGGRLGITLSLGEQTGDTYRRWFEAGAHRYLLRIETSNERLYKSIHPCDPLHDFASRLRALEDLRNTGYQVGTGVMIGLPGQSMEDLARDLMYMHDLDIDMCGMGPYVESEGTPLAASRLPRLPLGKRYDLSLKMVASLRLLMPDINIAATTAMQAIYPEGRLHALRAGANVIMPNITPGKYRESYFLYDNKPLSFDSNIIEKNIRYGEWGDPLRFSRRSGNR
ncbi:MAG: [FeFe] hydrogenase H-cluster radical SAM maturase HydE [Rikenellaceae bacterium]|nr:[FeFe] hydrogenase H-cluster radical SAM maturase HydE [Rikenellaceae bacterium]